MIGIGIDFGTSNSLVATFDGESVRLIPFETDSPIMPTATYIDRGFHTSTGNAAIERYIEDNIGRVVELAPEVIGRSEVLIAEESDELSRAAPQTASFDMVSSAQVDLNQRGRLFRGVKRLLGDEHTPRLMVFDKPYRLVALITPVLLRMRRTAEETLKASAARAHVGQPVNYEGRATTRNRTATERYREACRHAGIAEPHMYPEPIAAARSYLRTRAARADTTLTFDFGGGTLDLCVLRRTSKGFDVLATHGIGLGGDRIDQRLFERLLFPLLGKGETWRRQGVDRRIDTRFPFERYEALLLNWTTTYLLNQGRFREPILDRIACGGAGAEKFARLDDLVSRNYGYAVFQAIREMKARLSMEDEAVLDVPELDIELSVTRAELETMIADLLDEAAQGVDRVLELAELPADAIEVVVRTGGSSLIPAVTHLLDERFPGRVVAHDPFTSVAAGLAIADYERLSDANSPSGAK